MIRALHLFIGTAIGAILFAVYATQIQAFDVSMLAPRQLVVMSAGSVVGGVVGYILDRQPPPAADETRSRAVLNGILGALLGMIGIGGVALLSYERSDQMHLLCANCAVGIGWIAGATSVGSSTTRWVTAVVAPIAYVALIAALTYSAFGR